MCDVDLPQLTMEQLYALRDRAQELAVDSETWVLLGDVAKVRGNALCDSFDLAEACYLRALDLDSRDVEAMEQLGRLYYILDAYSDAIGWLERVLAIEPRPFSRDRLARCHAECGRWDIAWSMLADLELDGETEQAADLREWLDLTCDDSQGPSSTNADS